jgi:predicted CopG family antitoxin
MAFKQNEPLLKDETHEISLKTFENVLNQIESDMNGWLKKFNWNKETLLDKNATETTEPMTMSDDGDNQLFVCPYNIGHTKILKKNYDKHVFKCGLKMQNHQAKDIIDYSKQAVAPSDFQLTLDQKAHDNLLASHGNHYNYRNKLIDANRPLVSLTNDHLYINHTPQERLLLYNYSLDQFKKSGYPCDSNWNDETFLQHDSPSASSNAKYNDILVELRERKRRPKSYKTNKAKSFTDVLRDLIGTQMNLLEQLNEFDSKANVIDMKDQQEESRMNHKRSHSTDSKESCDQDGEANGKSRHHHKKKSAKKRKKKSKKSKE